MKCSILGAARRGKVLREVITFQFRFRVIHFGFKLSLFFELHCDGIIAVACNLNALWISRTRGVLYVLYHDFMRLRREVTS